jgi:DNA-binding beta-propeller fold protein YncE
VPAPGGLALPPAQPTAAWLYAPRGAHLGVYQGREVLIVADTGNHRVLIWHEMPDRDEQPCDVVLGQPDAFSEGPAAGRGDTKTGLHLPTGVLVHDGKLVIADAWHHRVLIYDGLPEAPGAVPDLVLGQPDLDSVTPNADGDCRPTTMYWPFGIAIIGGRFYVTDTGNSRVLGWSGGLPSTADTPPDLILGQPDGVRHDENRGGPPGQASFRWPHAMAGDETRLLVADAGNHRVLGWQSHPDADTGADLVLGQPGFDTASELPYGPQAASTLRFPYAIDADGTTLAVADTANNRVLLWDWTSTQPATSASSVLGQPGFWPNGENRWAGVTRDSLCRPYGLSLAGNRLAVADSGNNRVVIWEHE